LSIEKMSVTTRACAVVLLTFILLQELLLSAFRMYERKNVIHAKAEIGYAIKQWYRSNPQAVRRLFFPSAKSFMILEFASYLSYSGIPVEELPAGPVATQRVLLVGKAIQKDGPCGYRTFVCRPGSNPEHGDLVVVFPDDLTSVRESSLYLTEGSAPLFAYNPSPAIPQWMRPLVNQLHVASPVFWDEKLPDSWLNASLSVWK
jgi:hypothetical protein